MKVVVSSLVALLVFGSTVSYAHTRAPGSIVARSASFASEQVRRASSHNVPLYYTKSEDVSHSRYWTTPKAQGGGLESGQGASLAR